MRRTLWTGRIMSLSLAVAGCGASTPPLVETATPDPSVGSNGQVCRDERPIGSNISHRVCRDDDEAREAREQSRQWIRDPKSTSTP